MTSIFTIETAEDGVTPIRYSCEQLMENNEANALQVEYYYDVLHGSSESTADVVAEAEAALLRSVANNFGLIDGARCSIPPVTALWMIDVTSLNTDEAVDQFSSCLELAPGTGQTCSVYKGYMEAHYLGEGDPDSFQTYIQQNLNNIGTNKGFEIAYLGAQLDTTVLGTETARDNLNPSASQAEAPQTQEKKERTFTFVGGLMVAGLLAAVLGVFFVLYRRRQKFLAAQELEIALSKSDLDDMTPRDQEAGSGTLGPENLEPEIGDELPDEGHDEDFPANSSYRFDLATSMKNELFNIHGRAPSATRIYGIGGIEETSDSDADSWAQTDGTIGSLELQLEPITAEV